MLSQNTNILFFCETINLGGIPHLYMIAYPLKGIIDLDLLSSVKAVTFAENLLEMNEYTFEMVPGLVGRIAELMASIDQKLDKVNVAPIPTDDTPELMNVKDLGRYLPSHPAPSTVYSWVNDNTIPYYKQGKTLMFKKSDIDKWLLRTRMKDNTELMEEAQRYCATHPLGGRRK